MPCHAILSLTTSQPSIYYYVHLSIQYVIAHQSSLLVTPEDVYELAEAGFSCVIIQDPILFSEVVSPDIESFVL